MQYSNLNVFEDKHRLEIKNPSNIGIGGIFTGFFALAWNSFLVVWCSIAISSGIYIMLLFAIFHIMIGISLAKQTFQLLFARYKVVVDGGILTIRSNNPFTKREERFETNEINQIFVRQKTGMFSSRTANHQLVLEMYDGSRIEVNTLSTSQYELLDIERLLENHIGINNVQIPNEAPRNYAQNKARQQNPSGNFARRFSLQDLPIEGGNLLVLRLHDILRMNEETYDVVHCTQYDWLNGNTDKLLQIHSFDAKPELLLIKQNKGLISSFLEREMNILETESIAFDSNNPPKNIDVNGVSYFINKHNKGQSFINESKDANQVTEWYYTSLTKMQHIRITSQNNVLTWYQGETINIHDITTNNYLDLNKDRPSPPQKRTRNYDEDNFV